MIELKKEQYYITRVLLLAEDMYIEPQAVIDLTNPGLVFVGSLTNPKAAIVYVEGNNGFYFLGDFSSCNGTELNHFIDMTIIPRLKAKGEKHFEFSSVPPVTDTILEKLFSLRKLNSWEQTIFRYLKKSYLRKVTATEGQLYDIKDIWGKLELKNIEFLTDIILRYWESVEAFLEKAEGYALVLDDMIVSTAITGWIAGNVHEISIETVKEYRNRGYAKAASTELINRYLKEGYMPHWECETANIASRRLAEGFGFSKQYGYPCYGFEVEPDIN